MSMTVYGLPGNRWTNEVTDALSAKGIVHELVEQFEWTRRYSPYEDEHGMAFIVRMPTIRFHQIVEVWITGYEPCLEYINGVSSEDLCELWRA